MIFFNYTGGSKKGFDHEAVSEFMREVVGEEPESIAANDLSRQGYYRFIADANGSHIYDPGHDRARRELVSWPSQDIWEKFLARFGRGLTIIGG